jgi:voltage-gated potassium channel
VGFLSKQLVDLAYILQASKKYQGVKSFFYSLLEDESYPYKRYFDYFMMLLIISSVMFLVRQVKYPLPEYALFYNDYIISLIFLVEYLLRFWLHSSISQEIVHQYEKDEFLSYRFRLDKALTKILRSKWEYVSSYYAIIDLLAIMPFFHELRILRIFILFRAFKIFRYTKSLHQFATVLASKKFEFFTLMIFASVMISISSVLIYVAEANNENSAINTLFEAFYWSVVSMSTVGYGDFVPVTELGRSVAMIIIISGIAVISFMTSIVVSAFTEQLDSIREQKTITDISKMKSFYLICGFSELSAIVAKRLQKDGIPFVIMEKEPQKLLAASKAKMAAVLADPSKQESYENYKINIKKQVISVLCLEDTDVQNIYTALTIRAMHPQISILSYLHEDKNRKKLTLAGVDNIIYPQELIGVLAREFTGRPVAFEAIAALRSQSTEVVIEELLVDGRILNQRKRVEDLNVHKTKLILLGIYRKKIFHFNPKMGMELLEGDILVMIGLEQMIKEFSLNLHKRRMLK